MGTNGFKIGYSHKTFCCLLPKHGSLASCDIVMALEQILRDLTKVPNWRSKGIFHAKMGSIKDRNGMDLTEAEDIKKRWQEYTQELYKIDLHDQDNHDGVITHLQPDILECEVNWALESITMNKPSGGDGIPVELFHHQKMMLWKCCTQYASKFGKLSSGHRIGKGQFSFQSQRKAMLKNAQTIALMSHTSKVMLKIREPWTSWCSSWF